MIKNKNTKHFFTSESVTEGHPDKICDQLSDSVLDAVLRDDPDARVACECIVTTGLAFVMGEITTSTYVDFPKLIRSVICDIGYDDGRYGFDGNTCAVLNSIDSQSPDIAMGVDLSYENKTDLNNSSSVMNLGAGDQGMVFGFACDETKTLMPAPIHYAHELSKKLSEVRKKDIVKGLGPDGKSQVTFEYENDIPKRIDTVVVSTQHLDEKHIDDVRSQILENVIKTTLPSELLDNDTKYLINPTGRFVIGGPQGDSGLTGRKIIVDTYGGYARHGGGAFSGKDPTKVDRSGAYIARYAAKNIVASGLATKCEIEIAYAISVAKPVSVWVDTFGTGIISDGDLKAILMQIVDMRPSAIIEKLGLRLPIYRQTASYGHFGRNDLDLPWEKLDLIDEFKKRA